MLGCEPRCSSNLYAVLEQPLIGYEGASTRATSPEPGLRFAVGGADVAAEALRNDGLPCPPYEFVGAQDIYRIGQDLQRRAFSCAISTAWTCLPAGPRSARRRWYDRGQSSPG